MQGTCRELTHRNQNYMSMGVGCFDLRQPNLLAQLKALPAAIRFSGSSCFMLEGIEGSCGSDAEEAFACHCPHDSSTEPSSKASWGLRDKAFCFLTLFVASGGWSAFDLSERTKI